MLYKVLLKLMFVKNSVVIVSFEKCEKERCKRNDKKYFYHTLIQQADLFNI